MCMQESRQVGTQLELLLMLMRLTLLLLPVGDAGSMATQSNIAKYRRQ
jgi:hypothetical protein